MIKFIHAADIHLDSPLHGLSQYEGAPVEQVRAATRQAFTKMIDLAIDEDVNFVLIAGDLFDGDWKDFSTGLYFNSQMSRLKRKNIRVFVVSGNHDAESKISQTLGKIDNVHVFDSKEPETVLIEDIQVAVHGMSYAQPDIMEDISSNYPAPKQGFINIGVLHTCANVNSSHEQYAPCSPGNLSDKGYDYWALGHVHSHEILNQSPLIVFSGCMQGRNIRETGEKGCCIVSVDDGGAVSLDFQSVDVLRWKTIEIDATGKSSADGVMTEIRHQIESIIHELASIPHAIRVKISGKCDAHKEFKSDPDKWINEVRSLVTDETSGEAWVEKVVFYTKPGIDFSMIQERTDPVGDLYRFAGSLLEDEASKEALVKSLELLSSKLPKAASNEPDPFDIQDSQTLEHLAKNAQQLLIERVLEEEVSS